MENVSGPAHVLQTVTTLLIDNAPVEVITVECYPLGGSLTPKKIDDMLNCEAVELTVNPGNGSRSVWVPVTEETRELLRTVADKTRCRIDFTFTPHPRRGPMLTNIRSSENFFPVYKDKKAALASL